MNRIAQYLIDRYPAGTFQEEILVKALDLNQDRIVVVKKGDDIAAVAVFLTLTSESFKKIHEFNYFDAKTLGPLLKEEGPHVHFILVAASGVGALLEGAKKVINQKEAKSVSWWNNHGKLNRFKVN